MASHIAIPLATLPNVREKLLQIAQDSGIFEGNASCYFNDLKQILPLDPSIVIVPNATKAGKLYGIKGTDLDVVRATTATRVNNAGLIESVANNVPRLDYTNGSCPSILVEPQRTNLLLRSEEFENAAWTKASATSVTENTATAPDGTQNADSFILTNTSPTNQFLRGFAVNTGITTVTLSTFVKYVDKQYIQLVFPFAFSSDFANFDLINGTITDGIYDNASIKNYENGWYRITITTLSKSTNCLSFIWGIDASNSSRAQSSTNGSYLIWGAQLELGSNATSYIPTVASAVTRNADVISKTGIADLIGQTEGTLFVEADMNNWETSNRVLAISDGSLTNRIIIIIGSSQRIRTIITNGGTSQFDFNSASLTNGVVKVAVAYKNNDIAFYVNGIQVSTSSSATIPACSAVFVGKIETPSLIQILGDGIAQALLFKTRLSNAQLEELTTL